MEALKNTLLYQNDKNSFVSLTPRRNRPAVGVVGAKSHQLGYIA
jgi:hypothetical protein